MFLLERYGLCKDVETSSQQVNEDYFMIAHDAENSFVIIAADYWRKVDFDANEWMRFHDALGVGESKDVKSVCQKLKTNRQVGVIVDSQKSVRAALMLNLSKMDAVWWKSHIIALRVSLAAEFQLVAFLRRNPEVGAWDGVRDRGRVFDRDSYRLTWIKLCRGLTQSEGLVFSVVWDFVNCEVSGDFRRVGDVDLFGGGFTYKKRAEVEALLVCSDEWVLADRL